MKKFNGFSLIEMLVSIVLLSIVMIFSYGIVNQLVYIKNDNSIALDNQINRSLIIDVIQNDFIVYGLAYNLDIYDGFIPTKETDRITFNLKNYKGDSIIYFTESSLTYIDFTGKESKWVFKDNSHSTTNLTLDKYYLFKPDIITGTVLIQIIIPIYTNDVTNNGAPNNNIKDDIILTYYGPYLRID